MPRTTVRNTIHQYVKTHNLQNPKDGRQILLNLPGGEALRKTLRIPQEIESVTYFILQRYLSPHFTKVKTTEPDAPAPPAPPKDIKTKTQEALREAATPEATQAEQPKKKTIIRKKVVPQEA